MPLALVSKLMRERVKRLTLFLPALVGMLIYLTILQNDFVVDDYPAIISNSWVNKGISSLPEIWSHSFYHGYDQRSLANEYRPMASTLYALQVSLFGIKSAAYFHAVSVVLYGILIWLLTIFLLNFRLSRFWVIVGAVIFAVHPIHTEVVCQVKAQDDLLSGIFLLLAFIRFQRFLTSQGAKNIWMTTFFFLLALLSKESAFPFIGFFLVMAYPQLKLRSLLPTKLLPLLAPIGIVMLLRSIVLEGSPPPDVVNNALAYQNTIEIRLAMGFHLFWRYLIQLFLPLNLSWDYAFNQIPLHGMLHVKTLAGTLAMTALLIVAYKCRITKWPISVAISMFFLGLILYLQWFVLIEATYAERFLFLPSMAIPLALLALPEPKRVLAISILVAIAMVPAAWHTINRSGQWKDNLTLFNSDIEKCDNSIRCNSALAYELMQASSKVKTEEEYKALLYEAIDYYNKALGIYGMDANTWFNMGVAQLNIGEYTAAEQAFNECIKLQPVHSMAHNNLGNIEYLKGNTELAMDLYQKAVDQDAENATALSNLGAMLLLKNQLSQAIYNLEKALKLDPQNEDAQFNLERARKKLRY